MTLLLLHEILSATLFATCFCRATKTNDHTKRPVLLAFWLLSTASVLSLFCPLWGWEPTKLSTLILTACTVVQLTVSDYWRHGVPPIFQEDI